MSTNKKAPLTIAPEEWVTPAAAARLRGVTRQAIANLIRNERVAVVSVGGRKLVKLSDIENFEPKKPGRRKSPSRKNGKG